MDSPDPLLGAIELKQIWENRADFRQVRIPGSLFRDCGTLSWPMALEIAIARADHDPLEMIDSDWVDDWRRLKRRCEGYWSFADYALIRAKSEHFEDWDAVADPYREERIWLAGRTTPASDVSGMAVRIRDSQPSVPPEIASRLQEWNDEQAKASAQKPKQKAQPLLATAPPPAVAPDTPVAAVAAVAPATPPQQNLFAEEFESLFNTMKREMLETIKIANKTRDGAAIHDAQ